MASELQSKQEVADAIEIVIQYIFNNYHGPINPIRDKLLANMIQVRKALVLDEAFR